MRGPHCFKHWLFRNYLLLSGLALCAVVWMFGFDLSKWEKLAICVGGIVSFVFAVQKQQIEDVRLFREIFKESNERYDKLNEKLNRIIAEPEETPLTPEQINDLYDYFNLCGEEYLYYKNGFIYPEVWQSWTNGMKFFRRNRRIKTLWDSELKSCSYYGLCFDQEDGGCSYPDSNSP